MIPERRAGRKNRGGLVTVKKMWGESLPQVWIGVLCKCELTVVDGSENTRQSAGGVGSIMYGGESAASDPDGFSEYLAYDATSSGL